MVSHKECTKPLQNSLMNEKVFVPNNKYFMSARERFSQSYLLILLNALRKAAIATKIVFVTIFLGLVL